MLKNRFLALLTLILFYQPILFTAEHSRPLKIFDLCDVYLQAQSESGEPVKSSSTDSLKVALTTLEEHDHLLKMEMNKIVQLKECTRLNKGALDSQLTLCGILRVTLSHKILALKEEVYFRQTGKSYWDQFKLPAIPGAGPKQPRTKHKQKPQFVQRRWQR